MIKFICFCLLVLNTLVYARDIKVATGNFAPYFKVSANQRQPALYEQILSKGLGKIGLSPIYFKVSNDAIKRYYNSQRVDVAVNWTGAFSGQGYPSKYRLFFYNRAILSKESKWVNANNIRELKGAKIASFPGASLNFGNDFRRLIDDADTRYIESPDQFAINKMLVANKIDILVADWLKFYRFAKPLGVVHKFIPLNLINNAGSQIIFRDEKTRDAFDVAIMQMLQSGELDKLTLVWLASNGLPKVSHRFLDSKD